MPDPRLVISIPTYERADILEENLRRMAPALLGLGVPVSIFDDSRTDLTAQAVERLRTELGLELTYRRNIPALGHDANVIVALTAPRGDYVWLLGDSIYAEPADIEDLHRRLDSQDFVFLNGRDGAETPDRLDLTAAAGSLPAFLSDQVWQLTLTGATLYSARVISWWRVADHRVYTNFPQLSVILGFVVARQDARADWVGHRTARSNQRKVSYWLSKAIQTFGVDWDAVIRGHAGAFRPGSLGNVLASHSVHTGVLGFVNLVNLRASGELPWHVSRSRWQVLNRCSSCPAWQLAAITLTPAGLLSRARALRRRFTQARS